MEQEQWILLKKLFNWVITWKLLFNAKAGGGGGGGVGKDDVWKGCAKFWLVVRGLSPPSPSRENLIKFRVASINLLIFTGYYLLNCALASACSCSQKSWILFTVSTSRAFVHSFQNLIWTAMTLLFTATSFFCLCAWQVWFYLMLSKLNPSFNFHKEDLFFSRIIR